MTERPATEMAVLRSRLPLYGATVTTVVPLPVRPALTVTHDTPLEVVHAQVDCVVTVTVALPPLAVNASDVGETV